MRLPNNQWSGMFTNYAETYRKKGEVGPVRSHHFRIPQEPLTA